MGAVEALRATKRVEGLVDQAFLTALGEEALIGVGLLSVDGFPVIRVGTNSLLDLDNVLGVSGAALVAHAVRIGRVEARAVVHVAVHALHVQFGLVYARVWRVVCLL